jgi:hypothetical protein
VRARPRTHRGSVGFSTGQPWQLFCTWPARQGLLSGCKHLCRVGADCPRRQGRAGEGALLPVYAGYQRRLAASGCRMGAGKGNQEQQITQRPWPVKRFGQRVPAVDWSAALGAERPRAVGWPRRHSSSVESKRTQHHRWCHPFADVRIPDIQMMGDDSIFCRFSGQPVVRTYVSEALFPQ